MNNAQPNHPTSLEQPEEKSGIASAIGRGQRSLRHHIEQAIAYRLQAQLAHRPGFVHPAMQKALATEQQLLRSGKALRPKRNTSSLQYHWAIALRLYPHISSEIPLEASLSLKDLAATLANEIAGVDFSPNHFSQQGLGTNAQHFLTIWSDCFLSVEQSGLLQISVGDRAVILWLQNILLAPLPSAPLSSNLDPAPMEAGATSHAPNASNRGQLNENQLFWTQAAHARGCSLLRQGSLMHLVPPQIVEDLSIAIPDISGQGEWSNAIPLQSPQRPEWQLLRTTLAILDEWDGASVAHCWPLLQKMSQSVWQFDAHCRVLADAKRLPPKQSQIRFWILAIACKVLRQSLNSLGWDAPTTV